MIESRRGQNWVYTCDECCCEYVYAKRKITPPKCGHVCKQSGHWLTCPHRGAVLATVNARSAGCGCSGSTVEVYRCSRFGEPVVKHAAARCRDDITSVAPGYTGRTCRNCNLSEGDDRGTPPTSLSPVKTLVAITAYFNPQHATSRRNNYERFAAGLKARGIDLWTVEGLRTGNEPGLMRGNGWYVSCESVLWQKERLLNLAVERLPDYVDAVAWLDADLLFAEPDIRDKTLDALTRWPLIQPWQDCRMLDATGRPHQWNGSPVATSLAGANRGRPGDAHPLRKHPGFAWAARRETLIDLGGLYDRHITGGGDTAMAIGFYNDLNSPFLSSDRMGQAMLAHWRAWAERAGRIVRGRVGFVPGTIEHLYHGEIADRGYRGRWTQLSSHGYDPERHVEIDRHGALSWTNEAPAGLRQFVEDFLLRSRKEP